MCMFMRRIIRISIQNDFLHNKILSNTKYKATEFDIFGEWP